VVPYSPQPIKPLSTRLAVRWAKHIEDPDQKTTNLENSVCTLPLLPGADLGRLRLHGVPMGAAGGIVGNRVQPSLGAQKLHGFRCSTTRLPSIVRLGFGTTKLSEVSGSRSYSRPPNRTIVRKKHSPNRS
jgi:hypothetical protein